MEQKWLRTTALEYLCFAPKRLVKLTPFSFFFDSNDTTFAAISLKFNQFFWRFFFKKKCLASFYFLAPNYFFELELISSFGMCQNFEMKERARESKKAKKKFI